MNEPKKNMSENAFESLIDFQVKTSIPLNILSKKRKKSKGSLKMKLLKILKGK